MWLCVCVCVWLVRVCLCEESPQVIHKPSPSRPSLPGKWLKTTSGWSRPPKRGCDSRLSPPPSRLILSKPTSGIRQTASASDELLNEIELWWCRSLMSKRESEVAELWWNSCWWADCKDTDGCVVVVVVVGDTRIMLCCKEGEVEVEGSLGRLPFVLMMGLRSINRSWSSSKSNWTNVSSVVDMDEYDVRITRRFRTQKTNGFFFK